MPLVYQQNINATTKIGVWHIAEAEDFFLRQVPLHRSITHWHKRLQHLAGRLLLKELYPGFPLEEILIADTKKPFVEKEAWHFSISHSGDYAAALISKSHRVGVDVEWDNPKIVDIKYKFLSGEEMKVFNVQGATLGWSVKEAVYKWWGMGGVDFKKDILIKRITGTADQGLVHCVFKGEISLDVHFLQFNDNYLTWLLTGH